MLGLVSFRFLGGRFWAIAPSSYTHVGSFARGSIPATENYATQAQRSLLSQIGRVSGCHTCGTKIRLGRATLIADHQPPKSVAAQMNRNLWRRMTGMKVKYRFFPQCGDCSQTQGSILSSATRKVTDFWSRTNLAGSGGGRTAYYHGLQPRWYHLTGGVIAVATVLGASDTEISTGNSKRFENWQQAVGNTLTGRGGKTRNM